MTKEDVLNSLEQFLVLNSEDKRLVVSLKKSLEKLFEKYEANIPFKSLSISELKERIGTLSRSLEKNSLPESARVPASNLIKRFEQRIKELS